MAPGKRGDGVSESFLDGKVIRTCAICALPFSVAASRLKWGRGKHCSPECQHEARRQQPKKIVRLRCLGCGDAFTRSPSQLHGRRGAGKYCTRECRNKHWLGPLNPNWQSGDKIYKRGSHWHSIRRRIIARDRMCQHCGASGLLHVHHQIPFRVFGDKSVANGDWNLIALCPPCHRKEDARYKWVPLSEGALCFQAGSDAWQLAREKGMV